MNLQHEHADTTVFTETVNDNESSIDTLSKNKEENSFSLGYNTLKCMEAELAREYIRNMVLSKLCQS